MTNQNLTETVVHAIESSAWVTLQTSYPRLAANLQDQVERGATPEQIVIAMNRAGINPVVTLVMACAADYLLKMKEQTNADAGRRDP